MRCKERLPIVYNIFKDNKELFFKFIEIRSDQYYFLFKAEFDDLLEEHIKLNDLRFGQYLINEGIIPDNSSWYKEEVDFLIKKVLLNTKKYIFGGQEG